MNTIMSKSKVTTEDRAEHDSKQKLIMRSYFLRSNQSRLYSAISTRRRRTPARQSNGNNTKKLEKRSNKDPETYTRDKIFNIYRILKYSTWESAQQQLDALRTKWDSFTVNQILKTHPPMQKAWLFFNWVANSKGVKHDHYTYTTMLDIFGEAGRISSMEYVFKVMQEKGSRVDAVTYTSVMHWLSKSGDVDGAVRVWEEMKEMGCSPTVVSYTAYMKILFDNDRVKEGTDIYKEMILTGLSPTCHTYTVLMEFLVGCGKYDEALDMFSKMQDSGVQPDKATCNILIEKLSKAGQTQPIVKILQFMKENRIALRQPVFSLASETFKNANESDDLLRQVHPHFSDPESKLVALSDVSSTIERGILLMLLKKQSLIAVDHLLKETNVKLDPVIISIVIEGNCSRLRLNGALLAFDYGVKNGMNLEKNAYISLLGCLIRRDEFGKLEYVLKEMISVGHYPSPYLATLLIYRLGIARRPYLAASVFNLLPDELLSVSTFTALMTVYLNVGSSEKAVKIYEEMQSRGIRAVVTTIDLLVVGLESSGRNGEVERFRKEKKRWLIDGHLPDNSAVSEEEMLCDFMFGRAPLS